jgi:hypothetical protein
MLSSILRRATRSILLALIACGVPAAAHAGTINIILSDMDVNYLGGALFDAMGGITGGTLTPGTSDSISTAVFELDGVIQGGGPLVDDAPDSLHADFLIAGIAPSLLKGVFIPLTGNNNGAFGFDLFIDPPGAAPPAALLRLGTDDVSLLISNGVFFFTGQATVLSQNLPFGLTLTASQPVQFSYTATLPGVPNSATISNAIGSGAFTISGVSTPEPGTAGMLCLGLFMLRLGIARRQRLEV